MLVITTYKNIYRINYNIIKTYINKILSCYFIINTYRLTMSHINLYDDHKKLKKEYKALKAENLSNNYIISENIMPKSKIEDIVDVSSEILAKVLVDKQSPFLKSIIVFFTHDIILLKSLSDIQIWKGKETILS